MVVLDSNGGNLHATARDTGLPQSTIQSWRDREIEIDPELRIQKKEELIVLFDRVARAYLERALAEACIEGTKGKDAVTAAAIATDKRQLLSGQPTSITETSPTELKDYLKRMRPGLPEEVYQAVVDAQEELVN